MHCKKLHHALATIQKEGVCKHKEIHLILWAYHLTTPLNTTFWATEDGILAVMPQLGANLYAGINPTYSLEPLPFVKEFLAFKYSLQDVDYLYDTFMYCDAWKRNYVEDTFTTIPKIHGMDFNYLIDKVRKNESSIHTRP